MKHRLALLALLSLILPFRGQAADQPPAELRETIRIYNGLLADGYRRQDMNHLRHAATAERAAQAYYHMAALGEGGVKMDSTLRDLAVVDSKQPSPDTAEVTCRERWEYRYLNLATGNASPLLTVNYTSRYRLRRTNEQWQVADLTVLATDRESDAEELSFFNRPADLPPSQSPQGYREPITRPQTKSGP